MKTLFSRTTLQNTFIGIASLVLILASMFYVSGRSTLKAELAFAEHSVLGESAGSVVPASCDSTGVDLYDHNGFQSSDPGKRNSYDTSYDVKPCPPPSSAYCPAGTLFTTVTKYYCDYTTTGANGTPSPTRQPNPFSGSYACPVYYANTVLFNSAPNCNNITFTANPDGYGDCYYTVPSGNATLRSVNVNTCVTPTVQLYFQ